MNKRHNLSNFSASSAMKSCNSPESWHVHFKENLEPKYVSPIILHTSVVDKRHNWSGFFASSAMDACNSPATYAGRQGTVL